MKKSALLVATTFALSVAAADYTSVDLGLSVRWATYNVGASAPTGKGNLYAWGETTTKGTYSWSTYRYGTAYNTMTKYCTNSNYGTVDNLTTLEAADDAATKNWGGKWRTPTHAEWQELRTKCTWKWTDNYNSTNVKGYTITATNGNAIFLPATGFGHDSQTRWPDDGYYWSSSLSATPSDAYYMQFTSTAVAESNNNFRYYGQAVRPVEDIYKITLDASENGQLQSDKRRATAGETVTLTIVSSPHYGQRFSVMQGTKEITTTAVAGAANQYTFVMPMGNVTVTAEFEWIEPNFTPYPFTVNAAGKQVYFSSGNLQCAGLTAGDTVWSFAEYQTDIIGEANVSGSALADKIDLFGWSTTSLATWGISTFGITDYYKGDFVDWGTNAINANEPNTYRTLTSDEWTYIRYMRPNASDNMGVARINLNSDGSQYSNGLIFLPDSWNAPAGVTFTPGFPSASTIQAYADHQTFTIAEWQQLESAGAVFLPASGWRSESKMYYVQNYGNYWSATPESEYNAYYLICYGSGENMKWTLRYQGQAVRLVQDIKYSITLVAGANGTLVSDVERCATGDKVTLTITPAMGYELEELTVIDANKQTITVAEDNSFVMPAADVTVTATFVKKPDAKEYVDLGLPSGLLWATCNVGASEPEIYGDYYAWGETEPKETYSWETYKYGSGISALTKYCNDSSCGKDGFTDELTTLEAEDDAAAVNWGGKWRTPTDAEWTELRDNCDWTWTADYNGTGIAGRIVTSKTNGNSIFLPATGYRNDGYLLLAGDLGNYWSSSLYTYNPYYAWYVNFNSDYYNNRVYGQSVRPVQEVTKYAVTVTTPENGTVTADKTEAAAGKTITLTITPDADYELGALSVKDADNNAITVVDNKFTMPASAVTVTATFKKPDTKEWVDLGLPSGLRWATCNVGATSPEEYGNYYAWGETATKTTYSWETYKYGSSADAITKYCTREEYGKGGFIDGLITLEAEDDAAAVNWGGTWRMPTDAEWRELLDNCDWTWTADYNGTGIAGRIVASKTNGNTVFLPAAGYCRDYLDNAGNYGYYWSSSYSTNDPPIAWSARFDSDNVEDYYYYRCYGLSVRPVIMVYGITIAATTNGAVTADKTEAAAGDKVTLTITPDADYELGTLFVKDADNNAITVVDNKFTMPASTVTVTATFKKPDTKEWVDLGLPSGLRWATCNVGASAPEEYGNYYAWGETEPKETYSWETYKYGSNNNDLTKYCSDSSSGKDGFTDELTTLEAEDDAAAVNWGGEWRMPTDTEWEELRDNCDWTWTADYNGTGIAGRIVASKTNGNSIFLPAAGYRYGGSLGSAGDGGYYWSTSLRTGYPYYAWSAYFDSDDVSRGYYYRCYGRSVRPVQEVVKYAVMVTTPENGTVTADKTEAAAGETVTLTITPDADYRLGELTVTDANKQTVTVAEDHSFVMPAADVTVTAAFERQTVTAVSSAEVLELHAENGRIVCAQDFQIFDLLGRDVTRLNGSLNGVYIVRVGDKVQKVIVSRKM